MGRNSVNSLAPGFRFHPTDEELVRYYLRRKVSAKPFRLDPISVIDIYKSEPWDLPDKSKLKSRDLEWYFFSALDKKYSNGSKTNRSTEKGYWKTTGKDRAVYHNSRIIGMKKTLVYHCGRAPRGQRSNWVMHEYRLTDEELEKAGVAQDAFVLCRVFQKSGSGPKNGERYGAPFVDEEWEDNEVSVPQVKEEALDDEFPVAAYANVEADDIDQKFDNGIPPENVPIPMSFYHGETSNSVENPEDYIEDQKPMGENHRTSQMHDDQLVYLPGQYEVDELAVKDENIGEKGFYDDFLDVNFLLDEPYVDAMDNPQLDDGLFLETNDLSDTMDAEPINFDKLEEEYLTYFDADGGNSEYMAFDPSQLMNENPIDDEAISPHKHINEATEQGSMGSQHLQGAEGNTDASSSRKNLDDTKFESGFEYPLTKQASQILGKIHAAPAFGSEFSKKGSDLLLNQAAQASNSVHVTAGMIRIRNPTFNGNSMDWYFDKNGNFNVTISFSLLQGDVSSTSLSRLSNVISGKTGDVFSHRWLYLMFIWSIIIVSASFKIGSCLYTR